MNNQMSNRALRSTDAPPQEIIAPRTVAAEFIDVMALVVLLWQRKWLIGAIGFAVAVATYALMLRIDPYYTAEARLLIETRPQQLINIDNVVGEGVIGGTPAIESEIALIRTPTTLRIVAERLDLASRPEFNPTLSAPSAITAVVSSLKGLISRPEADGGEGAPEPSPVNVAAAILSEQVSVAQLGESFVLRIVATAAHPVLAARIANAVAEAHLEQHIERKSELALRATELLDQRLMLLREEVEAAELEVERGRAAVTAGGSASPSVLETQINQLSSSLVNARIENDSAVSRLESFQTLIAARRYGAAMQIASSTQLERLVERRDTIVQQSEALSRRSAGQGSDRSQIDATLATVETAIEAAAAEIARGLEAVAEISADQIRLQENQLAATESALASQSSQLIDLRALEREAEAKRQVYETVLARATETRELAGFQTANASIVSRAEPPSNPAGPPKATAAVLAAFLGCAVAAALVLWADISRGVLRKPDHVEAAAGVPLLGAFPRLHRRRLRGGELHRRLSDPPRDMVVAADRFAVGLGDAAHAAGKQVIMIASAVPGEGATALAFLLGRALALRGFRTAVIDCDSRAGGFLKTMSPPDGSTDTISDVASATGGELGFDVVRLAPAGDGPLTRIVARDAIARLRQGYEIVILDMPPVLVTADSLAIAAEVDAAILVVQIESTPSGAVAEAAAELRRVGAPLIGAVATSVDAALTGFRTYAGSEAVLRAVRGYYR